MAMLNAEELGVTKANVDQMKSSDNPEIKRLLGTEGKFGEAIGLTQRLGGADHQARGQLRRELRAQRGRGLPAEDQARPERALDQGRPAVRPTHPLVAKAPSHRLAGPLLRRVAHLHRAGAMAEGSEVRRTEPSRRTQFGSLFFR